MAETAQRPLSVGLVLLTTGTRPVELDQIVQQAEALDFDELTIVANGVPLVDRPRWRTVRAATNLGVPGGRNLGLASSRSDVLVFLDDDSSIPESSADLVQRVRGHFARDERLGALAFRVVGIGTNETLSRWDPTPRGRVTTTVCDVPTFPGNGHALRATAAAMVGGYLSDLFFKHEETELSWRLLDHGWRVRFDRTLVVEHPFTEESRHQQALELGLRNKIWLARLRLPQPLPAVAIVIAIARSLRQIGLPAGRQSIMFGIRSGVGSLPQHREPIAWRTVRHLSKMGRPPVL